MAVTHTVSLDAADLTLSRLRHYPDQAPGTRWQAFITGGMTLAVYAPSASELVDAFRRIADRVEDDSHLMSAVDTVNHGNGTNGQ